MIFELVEKKYHKFDAIAVVDVDTDDIVNHDKVIVTAPVHNYLAGVYNVWKYSEFGYVWNKKVPNSSISYILFFSDGNDRYDRYDRKKSHNSGPSRNIAEKYIYIYYFNPAINAKKMQQIARCEIILTSSGEISKWYVQDQETLQWNYTNNISYNLSNISNKVISQIF
jgi:hypothetical protein